MTELSLKASACPSTLFGSESFGWGMATVGFAAVRVALAGLCRGWPPQVRRWTLGGISRECLMPHSWGIAGRSLLRGLRRNPRNGSNRNSRPNCLRQGRTLPTDSEGTSLFLVLTPLLERGLSTWSRPVSARRDCQNNLFAHCH